MITAAMVGAEVTRAEQPNLPVTPQEIIAAAVECYEAGASIIHIHVRDAQGNATQDGRLFREVVEGFAPVAMSSPRFPRAEQCG